LNLCLVHFAHYCRCLIFLVLAADTAARSRDLFTTQGRVFTAGPSRLRVRNFQARLRPLHRQYNLGFTRSLLLVGRGRTRSLVSDKVIALEVGGGSEQVG
jgi:hypothetical protein